MAAIIELQKLNKTFGSGENQVNALQDVSISIEQGDIFGIIGLSGAGKSTLVRCINLLERPDSGNVLFHGQNLCDLRDKQLRQQRRKISMIFQSFNLLTAKPVIFAANVTEDDLPNDGEDNEGVQTLRKYAEEEKCEVFVVCAQIEQEIAELEDDEKKP